MTLDELIGLEQSNWMMAPSERLAIIGILQTMQPASCLEFGCAKGGLTRILSKYCSNVLTVDIDAHAKDVVHDLHNAEAWIMDTKSAAQQIMRDGMRFDLTIIDADHSRTGVRADLTNALEFSNVIVLHDTYYPPCRNGMLDVLENRRDLFYDLEFVPGGLQSDGLWGGLGIVFPGETRPQAYISRRNSLYHLMVRIHQFQQQTKKMNRMRLRIIEKGRRLFRSPYS